MEEDDYTILDLKTMWRMREQYSSLFAKNHVEEETGVFTTANNTHGIENRDSSAVLYIYTNIQKKCRRRRKSIRPA